MSVFGYVRVSTQRQSDEGESLGQQQRQLEGYAIMHGLDVSHIFVEAGVSGSIPIQGRPQGSVLFAKLQKGDTIIAAKLDRCFRSALDALQVVDFLKAKGVSLHLLDLGGDISGNGISKLFLTIMSAVAEAERDRIRERVTMSKADQKSRGRYLGGTIPYGFEVSPDGDLIATPWFCEALAEMQARRQAGESLRTIAVGVSASWPPITHMGVKEVLARNSPGG